MRLFVHVPVSGVTSEVVLVQHRSQYRHKYQYVTYVITRSRATTWFLRSWPLPIPGFLWLWAHPHL